MNSLTVLVGASGSGKSTWAAARYRSGEIVSSDALRAVTGRGEHDLDASADAFAALDLIVAARVRRRLPTVIDTLGTDPARRRAWLALARAADLRAEVVVLDTGAEECRRRNRARGRQVPAAALTGQLRRVAATADELAAEGWDAVTRVVDDTVDPTADPAAGPRTGFVLQISRFPWDPDPAAWLTSVATAAAEAGFAGLALMDHLLQIPQVGRAWEPIPEPWVTLGLLAALPTSLQLGTLVSPLSLHHPGRLAKAAATLDVLSGGRAFCGVGAGWFEREHLGFGIPFASAGERVDDLERGLRIMRALWAPGTKPAAGLPETTAYPRPVGALPLLVGGRGERVLRIAAELADGCNVRAEPDLVDRAVTAMAGKRVTVLDVPAPGDGPDHLARRYTDLFARGADTVFVALPDLTGPDDVLRFGAVINGSGGPSTSARRDDAAGASGR